MSLINNTMQLTDAFAELQTELPIYKCEKFDEDNMKELLNDENYNKKDRYRLSLYNKHRISGGKVNVSYKFGAGCEEHKLGRLYPEDGIGLQAFRFDMRNPLIQKHYWDTDVENAHFIIALKFCREYKITHDNLLHYIKNRNECLKMVSNSRKKAKTEFLKVLYGGDIKLYSNHYTEVEGDITMQGFSFLKELQKEMEALAIMIWEKHPKFHNLKTGKEAIISKKRTLKRL